MDYSPREFYFEGSDNLPHYVTGCSIADLPKLRRCMDTLSAELSKQEYQGLSVTQLYECNILFQNLCRLALSFISVEPEFLTPSQFQRFLFADIDDSGEAIPPVAVRLSYPQPKKGKESDTGTEATLINYLNSQLQNAVVLGLVNDLNQADKYAESHSLSDLDYQIETRADAVKQQIKEQEARAEAAAKGKPYSPKQNEANGDLASRMETYENLSMDENASLELAQMIADNLPTETPTEPD